MRTLIVKERSIFKPAEPGELPLLKAGVTVHLESDEKLLPVRGSNVFITSITSKVIKTDGTEAKVHIGQYKDSYPYVNIRWYGRYTPFLVHRLVVIAHIEEGSMKPKCAGIYKEILNGYYILL